MSGVEGVDSRALGWQLLFPKAAGLIGWYLSRCGRKEVRCEAVLEKVVWGRGKGRCHTQGNRSRARSQGESESEQLAGDRS